MKCKHETKACYGVALSNVAFASCEGEKVKCYMNFLRPENIFLLNLWQDPRPTRDFSHLLSDEFYHSKQFEKQTCEKVDLKNARLLVLLVKKNSNGRIPMYFYPIRLFFFVPFLSSEIFSLLLYVKTSTKKFSTRKTLF